MRASAHCSPDHVESPGTNAFVLDRRHVTVKHVSFAAADLGKATLKSMAMDQKGSSGMSSGWSWPYGL